MSILTSSIARGMVLISSSASDLPRKVYGVVFGASGTFTGVTEMGDSVSILVVASQSIPCTFVKITAAPSPTYGYKLT